MYIKLGKKASCFYDMSSKVNLRHPDEPAEVKQMTKRIQAGLNGGAIVEIQPDEFEKMNQKWLGKNPEPPENPEGSTTKAKDKDKGKKGKGKDKEPDEETPKEKLRNELKKKNEAELLAYYKDSFSVEAADEKAFNKMSPEEKVEFLLEDEE